MLCVCLFLFVCLCPSCFSVFGKFPRGGYRNGSIFSMFVYILYVCSVCDSLQARIWRQCAEQMVQLISKTYSKWIRNSQHISISMYGCVCLRHSRWRFRVVHICTIYSIPHVQSTCWRQECVPASLPVTINMVYRKFCLR